MGNVEFVISGRSPHILANKKIRHCCLRQLFFFLIRLFRVPKCYNIILNHWCTPLSNISQLFTEVPDQCYDSQRPNDELSLQALTFRLFTATLITVYMLASVSLALIINVFQPYSLIMDITASQEGNYIWEMGGSIQQSIWPCLSVRQWSSPQTFGSNYNRMTVLLFVVIIAFVYR